LSEQTILTEKYSTGFLYRCLKTQRRLVYLSEWRWSIKLEWSNKSSHLACKCVCSYRL